jgi:Ser/Thr protein kinase RdoA (MazF antagonist)
MDRDLDATSKVAMTALSRWSGARQNLIVPFGTSASSVFGVRINGATHFLRLTSQSFRTAGDVTDELGFLRHLCSQGVRVAMPVPSIYDRMVERVGGYHAALFRRAPGLRATPEARLWNRAFFREWGRTLAFQHQAARTVCSAWSGWRQDWRREPVLVEGLKYIRGNDKELAHCVDAILAELNLQGDAFGDVGMIHADLGPQNFRYDPEFGITAFDFDNCCRHWFLYDIAVALSVLRLRSEREQLVQWIFEGYRDVHPLPGDPGLLRLLLRLRLLYVYCDRLYSFGVAPGPDQRDILRGFRDRLIVGDVW